MIVNIRKHSCSFIHIIVILLSFFYDPIRFLRDLDELVPAPILPLPAFPPAEPFPGIYHAAASQTSALSLSGAPPLCLPRSGTVLGAKSKRIPSVLLLFTMYGLKSGKHIPKKAAFPVWGPPYYDTFFQLDRL